MALAGSRFYRRPQFTILSAILSVLSCRFRSRSALELEAVALRHQLAVLTRQHSGRPRLGHTARHAPHGHHATCEGGRRPSHDPADKRPQDAGHGAALHARPWPAHRSSNSSDRPRAASTFREQNGWRDYTKTSHGGEASGVSVRPTIENFSALSGGYDGAQGRNRTTDTRIFSPLLYRLSYLGMAMGSRSEGRL